MVVPGTYTVSLSKRVDGATTELSRPERFETEALGTTSLPAADKKALLDFQQQTAALQRAVLGAVRAVEDTAERLSYMERAILQATTTDPALLDEVRALEERLDAIDVALSGDATRRRRYDPVPPASVERVEDIVSGQWSSTSAPTETNRASYRVAAEAFEPVLDDLRSLIENDVTALGRKLDLAGAPWTPGRLPSWRR
jgi:hypothetical protein